MKKPEHKLAAKKIGADAWDLLNFNSLPDTADTLEQVDALRRDRDWMIDHVHTTTKKIDELIVAIEDTAE